MAAPDRQEAPPVGEEIHLPGPTALPFVMAIGITLVVVGLTISPILIAFGVLVFLYTLVRWIGDVRRDIDELPLEHEPH
jgi:hypothetical protein